MRLPKIIAEGDRLLTHYKKDSEGRLELEQSECHNYEIWIKTGLFYMESYHSSSSSIKVFQERATNFWNNYYSINVIRELLAILKGIQNVEEEKAIDSTTILDTIFNKFPVFVQQLKRRHENRPTIEVKDEYDVQDLLEAILRLHFNDVRAEEYCPSYVVAAIV